MAWCVRPALAPLQHFDPSSPAPFDVARQPPEDVHEGCNAAEQGYQETGLQGGAGRAVTGSSTSIDALSLDVQYSSVSLPEWG